MKKESSSILAIHQPECMPWIGFFNKMILADKYLLLDDVQFCKNNFQNRNQISLHGKKHYLTLPVSKSSNSLINEVTISQLKAYSKIEKTIVQAYQKYPYFELFFPKLQALFQGQPSSLIKFNTDFIDLIRNYLSIDTPLFYSSQCNVSEHKTQRIISLVHKMECNTYIAGKVSFDYLQTELFKDNQIRLLTHFVQPQYKSTTSNEFISHLSIIDLLMQYSPKVAYEIVCKSGDVRCLHP